MEELLKMLMKNSNLTLSVLNGANTIGATRRNVK